MKDPQVQKQQIPIAPKRSNRTNVTLLGVTTRIQNTRQRDLCFSYLKRGGSNDEQQYKWHSVEFLNLSFQITEATAAQG
jgi:hypothetical protein